MSCATDNTLYKMDSHWDAASKGFISIEKQGPAFAITPHYPGVVLKGGGSWRTPQAMCLFIPVDEACVSPTFMRTQKGEYCVDMKTTEDTSYTELRLLLVNFSDTASAKFLISDGGNDLVNLILPPETYVKVPGTTMDHKVIVVSDTGLSTSSPGQQALMPKNNSKLHVSIMLDCATAALIDAADTRTTLYVQQFPGDRSDTPSQQKYAKVGRYPRDCPGGDEVADGPGGDEVADGPGGEEVADGMGKDEPDGAATTSCVVGKGTGSVHHPVFRMRKFNAVNTFSVYVYFTKTQVARPPKFVLCRDGKMFCCPCKIHAVMEDAFVTADEMKCACVQSPSERYEAARALQKILATPAADRM